MKTFVFTSALLCAVTLNAQERGNIAYDASNNVYVENAVYGNYGSYGYPRYSYGGNNSQMLPNDSVYTLNARVLINLTPDAYVAVFNVQQEGLNVAECTKLITARIDKFKTAIKNEGVKDEEIFIDLIAQTRIYDYKIVGKTATETTQGFELKKNIIIRFTNHALLEKLLLYAAEQEIYDIVKVDYIINDMEKVQEQLRKEAVSILENKKQFALANSSLILSDKGLIQYENINTIYPAQSYRQYVAAETASVQPSYYNRDTWVKEQRKSKTFYFEKQSPAQFDKVINASMVQIPVQMTLDISVKYYIGKPEPRKRK
ncbi:MAG: SIMPL domain-containing protein [Flavobacteriales bacterium]